MPSSCELIDAAWTTRGRLSGRLELDAEATSRDGTDDAVHLELLGLLEAPDRRVGVLPERAVDRPGLAAGLGERLLDRRDDRTGQHRLLQLVHGRRLRDLRLRHNGQRPRAA